MRGVYSPLPVDSLDFALAPIMDYCAGLDWAVDLYSGPFSHPDCTDEGNENNFLDWYGPDSDDSQLPMGWFRKGFFPQHAELLALDEWSYFIGFDADVVSPQELAERFFGKGPRQPTDYFECIPRWNLLYLFRIDEGWWEAFTPDHEILEKLLHGWNGYWIDSDRWEKGKLIHPGIPK